MTSNTFRVDLAPAPSGFRTPSPPPYEPFNPLSPGTTSWSTSWAVPQRKPQSARRAPDKSKTNGKVRQKRKSYGNKAHPKGADDLTHGPPLVNGKPRQVSGALRSASDDLPQKRPSKRAKSERIPTNEELSASSRPHTSYHAQTEVQRADAELLLNFSRTASSEATNGARRSLISTKSPSSPTLEYQPLRNGDCGPNRQAPVSHTSPAQGQLQVSDASFLTQDWMHPKPSNTTNFGESIESQSAQPAVGSATIVEDAAPETETAPPEPSAADRASSPGLLQPKPTSNHNTDTAIDPGVNVNEGEDQKPMQILQGIEEAAGAPEKSALQGVARPEDLTSPQTHPARQPPKSPSICAGCSFHRNSQAMEGENEGDSWISCDGCKSWFHFACAGFKNEREVRSVDKFRCRKCKSIYGPTTYVRKSARAHSAIDYAGLNEGIVKTSDENPLHHYIKPIKDGTIKFDPENFARMRPELVTRDFFEKGDGMREPVVIPAEFNPRPCQIPDIQLEEHQTETKGITLEEHNIHDTTVLDSWLGDDFEFEQVEDNGQDALNMVIPIGLTVRKVSELYGPDEKIDVIDVKSQNGEDKKWTMKRWVDYYESKGSKKVRNVISLEVSQSKLGRLIQRPKVVRQLDLQDSVWPADLIAKGDYPKVQFYCLMSVADCYTDFHIDFGGSSVYYHILEGKKTFFFIPPYEKHLKKYEEWCNSPAQNWTFLGDQTKECYRVDLSAGDTMLIPAGWIHAVWTPEDSLVIGGNFLTRLNLPMQIRVTQIEKATFVDRKFRYPAFQKVMWYTALRYLEDDPVPPSVVELLASGREFQRKEMAYLDFDGLGQEAVQGTDGFHSRYYSKAELDGLPELARYLQRTALIATGHITEGITTKTQEAVKRSIPKGSGDPLQTVKKFAMWCTWKRGNETIPHWAYPDFVPEGGGAELAEKKLSAKAMKRLDREAAVQALKIIPDRQSARVRSQPGNAPNEATSTLENPTTPKQESTMALDSTQNGVNGITEDTTEAPLAGETVSTPKRPQSDGSRTGSGRKNTACEACRKGRRACKHRESNGAVSNQNLDGASDVQFIPSQLMNIEERNAANLAGSSHHISPVQTNLLHMDQLEIVQQNGNIGGYLSRLSGPSDNTSLINAKSSGRSKACKDCRKSKRRCIHDEFGNQDPVKAAEVAIPRPAAKKRKANGEPVIGASPKSPKRPKKQSSVPLGDGETLPSHEAIVPDDNAVSPDVQSTKQSPEQTMNETTPDSALKSDISEDGDKGAIPLTHYDDLTVSDPPALEAKQDSPGEDEPEAELSNSNGASTALVSPPESSHTDVERSSPTNTTANGLTSPVPPRAVPAITQPEKAVPRYTPDSNAHGQLSINGDAASPTASVETPGSQKRRASRPSSDHEADEESLKLIRQLTAQDMGLRRRAKVL